MGICTSLLNCHASEAFERGTTPHIWLIVTLRYAIEHNIEVDLQVSCIKPARQGDHSLMSIFSRKGYSVSDLQRLNRVRLWYRIFLLSELCTAQGRDIEPYHLGRRGVDAVGFYRCSRFEWAYQQRPPRADFKLFRDAVRLCFCHDKSWRLRSPLGDWDM